MFQEKETFNDSTSTLETADTSNLPIPLLIYPYPIYPSPLLPLPPQLIVPLQCSILPSVKGFHLQLSNLSILKCMKKTQS